MVGVWRCQIDLTFPPTTGSSACLANLPAAMKKHPVQQSAGQSCREECAIVNSERRAKFFTTLPPTAFLRPPSSLEGPFHRPLTLKFLKCILFLGILGLTLILYLDPVLERRSSKTFLETAIDPLGHFLRPFEFHYFPARACCHYCR